MRAKKKNHKIAKSCLHIKGLSQMEIAIIGDIHANHKNYLSVSKALTEAFSIIANRGISDVIILGDIFDHYNVSGPTASVGTVASAVLYPLTHYASQIDIRIIRGNHDIPPRRNTDPLIMFESTDRIDVFRRPEIISFGENGNRTNILFIPWLTKDLAHTLYKERAEEKLQESLSRTLQSLSGKKEKKIIVGHFNVTGAKVTDKFSLVDSSFELTRAQIELSGADIVIAGHIHKRQKIGDKIYFVGAIQNINFGEAGNPAGFAILNTANLSLEFIELNDAQRYFVFDFPEDFEKAKDSPVHVLDNVRIFADEITPEQRKLISHFKYIARVEIRKKKINTPEIRRTKTEYAGKAPREVFALWCKEKDISGDNLFEIVDSLATEKSVTQGALDSIDNVLLENIGVHETTVHDIPRDVIAVCGPNGSGKTFFLEALYAAAFGEFPSRRGTLIDRLKWGKTRGTIHVEFTAKGRRYEITRYIKKTSKGGTQTAYINEIKDGSSTPLAGPKISDVKEIARTIIGDEKLILATIYAAQGGVGELIDAPPRDRKDIFARLLGSEDFLYIGDKAREIAADYVSAATELRGKISFLENEIKKYGDLDQERRNVELKLKKAIRGLDKIEIELKAARETEKTLLIQDAQRKKDIEANRAVENKMAALADEIANIECEINTLLTKIVDSANINELKAERAEILNAIKERDKIREEIANRKDSVAIIDKKTAALNNKRAMAANRFNNAASIATESVKRLQEECENIKRRMSYLLEFEYDERCKSCPLYADVENSEKEYKQKAEEIKRITLDLEKIESETTAEIADIERELLKKAAQREEITKEINALEESYALYKTTKGLDEIEKKIEIAEKRREIEAKIEQNRAIIGEKKAELKRLESQIIPIKDNKIGAKLFEAREKIRELEVNARDLQEAIMSFNGQIATINEWIARKAELEKRISDAKSALGKAETRAREYNIVAGAFSKDGIPQLIIDSSLPQIHDILDEIFELFDGRFNVRVRTLKQIGSGAERETVEIIVSDENGNVAPIEEFSGGEKKLIKTCLRIALMIFQARRFDNRYNVFVVDEAFDQLDYDNVSMLQALLLKLKNDVSQILIGTHNEKIIADIRNKITFSR